MPLSPVPAPPLSLTMTLSLSWTLTHLLLSRIELRALRKVSEGEELTVSYVDFLDTSAERSRKLKENFYFECSCESCRQHLKDDLMMAAAAGAAGGKVRQGGGAEVRPQV